MIRYSIKMLMLAGLILFTGAIPFNSKKLTASRQVEVTYIANEGFLIETGNKKILIDALFGPEEFSFCETPDKLQMQKMTRACGAFSDVDLVAATHNHRDHFHAPFVSKHLLKNEEACLVSTEQSAGELRRLPDYEVFKNRIKTLAPDQNKFIDTLANGIAIRAYRLQHGPYFVEDSLTGEKIDKHRNVQNLGFLFNINGIKIFHSGDSSPKCREDYEHFNMEEENIDIAFLGRSFVWEAEKERLKFLKKHINPNHIILMHIHPNNIDRFKETAQSITELFPNITIFEKRMMKKTFYIHEN